MAHQSQQSSGHGPQQESSALDLSADEQVIFPQRREACVPPSGGADEPSAEESILRRARHQMSGRANTRRKVDTLTAKERSCAVESLSQLSSACPSY